MSTPALAISRGTWRRPALAGLEPDLAALVLDFYLRAAALPASRSATRKTSLQEPHEHRTVLGGHVQPGGEHRRSITRDAGSRVPFRQDGDAARRPQGLHADPLREQTGENGVRLYQAAARATHRGHRR